MHKKTTIALLQANTGTCYNIAKILSKEKNIVIDVIHHEEHIIKNSKYINNFHIVYSPLINADKSIDEINAIIQKEKYDLIIPINDVALELCLYSNGKIDSIFQDNNFISDSYRDKIKIWELAKQLGLPTIQGECIITLEEYKIKRDKINLPIISKPRKSAQLVNGRIQKFSVQKCDTLQQLDNYVTDNILNTHILLQEHIEGFGAGFNFFSINGSIISYYSHERLTESNGGGVSSNRKTIDSQKYNLLETSRKIIKEMNWTGIGMLEYRISDGVPYIIELNGRPWGSMMLGVYSKTNPINDYIQWKLNGTLPTETNKFNEIQVYKLKEEIKNKLSKRNIKAILSFVKLFFEIFLGALSTKQKVEDVYIEDPRYFIEYWKLLHTIQKKREIEVPTLLNIKLSAKICFVCYGNINRSPFAEKLFRKQFAEIKCVSTGLINKSNRMSPIKAIDVASQFGVNLLEHKSSYILEREFKDWTFVVMDRSNAQIMTEIGINVNQIFKLSDEDIPDPHMKSEDEYTSVFSLINQSIRNMSVTK